VIPACTVLIPYSSETGRQRDGQTDRQTPAPWLRRAKHSAISRVKTAQTNHEIFTVDCHKDSSFFFLRQNFVPLGERTNASKRGTPFPQKVVIFTAIGSSSVETIAGRHKLILTSVDALNKRW